MPKKGGKKKKLTPEEKQKNFEAWKNSAEY